MSAPQGLAHFPGIQQIRRASFTLSHGITPSSALIEIVPQQNIITENGTLTFAFGTVLLQFHDCQVVTASIRRSTGQGSILSFRLIDRRWKWRYGYALAQRNVRTYLEEIDTDSEWTPQELAGALLEDMGETRYDVSALPNLSRPEVSWEFSNPAAELQKLVSSLGCRIVLGLDNRVTIQRTGVGRDLPSNDQRREGYGVTIPQRPDSLLLVGGPTRYQYAMRLEAVGEDTDGAIRPIEELSYRPFYGWEDSHPDDLLDIEDKEHRQLAVKTVYRMYRIKYQAHVDAAGSIHTVSPGVAGFPPYSGSDIAPPGYNRYGHKFYVVNSINQLLPISSKLIDTHFVPTPDGGLVEFPNDAFIEGDYYDNVSTGITEDEDVTNMLYPGSFSIEENTGIVRFATPVYRLHAAGDESYIRPAILYLTTSSGTTDEGPTIGKGLSARILRERRMPGRANGSGEKIIRKEEIVQWIKTAYHPGRRQPAVMSITSNVEDDLLERADHILNEAQLEFVRPQTKQLEYAGLKAIEPDGAIQQVSWSVGPGGATTRASLNSEFDPNVPSYEERIRQEFVQQEIDEQREEQRKKGRGT